MINSSVVEFVLSKISDGMIFERFGQEFLSVYLGYSFNPVGGTKDKGIDGLEAMFSTTGRLKRIYQLSIETNCRHKIRDTVKVLRKNNVEFERLTYVTNQKVKDKPLIEDELYDELDAAIVIWDVDWFATHINEKEQVQQVFRSFQDRYLHEFSTPGKAYEVTDLAGDPRVYVFLSQQWDKSRSNTKLDDVLVDTLILFALEGTDPSENIFRTRDEILSRIQELVRFDISWLEHKLSGRLKYLSTKPRQIKYHTEAKGYCLPYETRLTIQEKNIQDIALYENFKNSSEALLSKLLQEHGLEVNQPYILLEQVLHHVFREQGLEFAEFVESKGIDGNVEKQLPEIIAKVIDKSSVKFEDKRAIKTVLHETVRYIVYKGATYQLEFLKRLSDTYRLLFLLQCDPRLATHFSTMANKLRVYVDNSILIPAMSEQFLDKKNRRYWNLLESAKQAGVNLLINDIIINELTSHFRSIREHYRRYYEDEEVYYDDEEMIYYIDNIMIRAFFYAKLKGAVASFEEFLDAFLTSDLSNQVEELILWLEDTFGIRYESLKSLGLNIDLDEEELLYEEMKKHKPSDNQARSDTKQLLTIYALRDKNQELSTTGEFGYNTWWLTTDTISQKAYNNVSTEPTHQNPYLRVDFLYNYIVLAPSKEQVDETYEAIFPTLLGVNISYHVPNEVRRAIADYLKRHKALFDSNRLRAIMRTLNQKLKSDPTYWTSETVILWLEEQKFAARIGLSAAA